MLVYSLTGPSGTGKSYQAMNLCQELHIESMIDDGLFIYRNRVEAGTSAKHEKTKVGAIKAAVFVRPEHREQVAARIRALRPRSILILGTSDDMADKIASRLGLPPVMKRIHIEDITTPEERGVAQRQRNLQGKHVIPVPTMQLKRDFAGYFMDPLRIFKNSGIGSGYSEKTVVRPTFSYMGEFYISEHVITDIAECVAEHTPHVNRVMKVYDNMSSDALVISVMLSVDRTGSIWASASDYQHRLAREVENMTAFNVVKVDIQIREIS